MKANIRTVKNGSIDILDSQNPYTAENTTEQALLYYFREMLCHIGAVDLRICADDENEASVFDRLAELETSITGKLDAIHEELRLLRTEKAA